MHFCCWSSAEGTFISPCTVWAAYIAVHTCTPSSIACIVPLLALRGSCSCAVALLLTCCVARGLWRQLSAGMQHHFYLLPSTN